MEEMHRAKYGERMRSFHAISENITLPKSAYVHQPRRSLNPVLLGLYGGVDLKQIDCQLFLQPEWVYSGSAENCNLGSATTVSHAQVPHGKRRRTLF